MNNKIFKQKGFLGIFQAIIFHSASSGFGVQGGCSEGVAESGGVKEGWTPIEEFGSFVRRHQRHEKSDARSPICASVGAEVGAAKTGALLGRKAIETRQGEADAFGGHHSYSGRFEQVRLAEGNDRYTIWFHLWKLALNHVIYNFHSSIFIFSYFHMVSYEHVLSFNSIVSIVDYLLNRKYYQFNFFFTFVVDNFTTSKIKLVWWAKLSYFWGRDFKKEIEKEHLCSALYLK